MPNLSADGLFYDLTFDADNFQVPPGLLAGVPGGLRALGGNDFIDGSSDGELLSGNQGQDRIFGNGGSDTVLGGKDDDDINGNDDNDFLFGNKGSDILYGDAGDDFIRGGKDLDYLFGGDGNDTLIGDFGHDLLVGNGGNDVFVLRTDTVGLDNADGLLDFDPSSDRIGLTGGITEANILLESQNFSLIEALNLSSENPLFPAEAADFFTPDFVRFAFEEVTGVDIDPDGDGMILATAISIQSPDGGLQELGLVYNTAPADLSGTFIPVSV